MTPADAELIHSKGLDLARRRIYLHGDGMVKDDGVTARLGPDHYHLTTTTGGAASGNGRRLMLAELATEKICGTEKIIDFGRHA